jgi:glutamine amidotransferase
MPPKVVILNYGAGNLHSVEKALDRIGASSLISSDAGEIASADKILLPGVGHFGKAMSSLKELNLKAALNNAVLVKRRPILGICLGMELMANWSDEGDAEGLGWFDAEMVKFDVSDKLKYKIPHIGWNRLDLKKPSRLMDGVGAISEFYFVHSYHLRNIDPTDTLSETVYESAFASAIEKENIFGVQFHPEKSHDAGLRILKNFIEM